MCLANSNKRTDERLSLVTSIRGVGRMSHQSIKKNKNSILREDEEFWKNGEVDKNQTDIVSNLEHRAHSGIPMKEFSLRRTNLQGLNLVNKKGGDGYQLSHSDLYRANLKYGHFF